MKARAFAYQRVASIDEAIEAHRRAAGEAAFIAGGQSLAPALALRLQAPALLVDIAHIDALRGISLTDGELRIGALTRHSEILGDPLVARHAPLLAQAAPFVSHPAIRNRGTLGGSAAHADPAAEFPAVLMALRARFEIAGESGARMVGADDFFVDLFETALGPGELLVAIHIPAARPDHLHGFDELAIRRGDFALVGCAAQLAVGSSGLVREAGIALLSVGPKPIRAASVEVALIGAPLDTDAVRRAQSALDEDIDPPDDVRMPPALRRRLARVLLGRVLSRMTERS